MLLRYAAGFFIGSGASGRSMLGTMFLGDWYAASTNLGDIRGYLVELKMPLERAFEEFVLRITLSGLFVVLRLKRPMFGDGVSARPSPMNVSASTQGGLKGYTVETQRYSDNAVSHLGCKMCTEEK